MKRLTFTLIALAIFTTASLAQDIDKPTQARWHVARALLSREWPAEQRAFLLRAATEPNRGMEAEARELFSRRDLIEIFYKIGTGDTGKYRAVRALDTLAAKKILVGSLSQAEKALVWRTHLAFILATRDLTPEQRDLLIDAADYIGAPDEARGIELGRRSREIFGEEGREIFGTIGPFASVGRLCREPETKAGAVSVNILPPPNDCVCSVNGTNWSCYDTCQGGTNCNLVDGCGFMWMWRCNGTCRTEPTDK